VQVQPDGHDPGCEPKIKARILVIV
jgi:hypothetical protein